MKINALNNINFGRAVLIKSSTKNTYSEAKELEKTLNRERSDKYTKKEARKIRAFFRDILEDYNYETPVKVLQTKKGSTILLSGEEAKNNSIRNIIRTKLEDGRKGKPESVVSLTETGISDKVSKIKYEYTQIEYSSYSKNRKLSGNEIAKENKNNIYMSAIIYETKSIDLKG